MTTKIEMEKRKIWAKHEGTFGKPIPEQVRDAIENEVLNPFFDDEARLKDLDHIIPERLALIVTWQKNNLHVGNEISHQPETEPGGKTTKEKYQKCFKRRLHLVEFVAGSVLTTVNLALQIFTPHKRIKWRLVCDKWNKEHPHDLMTPVTLKGEYYHAIREKDIHREYFSLVAEWMGPMREGILRLVDTDDIRELMKKKPMPEDEAFEILYREIIKGEREAHNEDSNTTKRTDLY